MSQKKNRKFKPKSGNPVKRAQEISDYKERQQNDIERKRRNKEYDEKLTSQNYTPQDVGGLYTPPSFLERIEEMEAPKPKKPKSKSDKRRSVAVVAISFLALSGLVLSTLIGLDQAFNNQELIQQDTATSGVDENGNKILVDRDGNPIDGSAPIISPEEESSVPQDSGITQEDVIQNDKELLFGK